MSFAMLNPWNVSLKRGDDCWYTTVSGSVPVWRAGKVLAVHPELHVFDVVDENDDSVHRVYQAWVFDPRS